MKKTIFASIAILVLAMSMVVGAQDFVSGEMKGSDASQAFKIGGDDPTDDLFVKTMQPVPLSGIDSNIFESAFFMQKDWVFDTTSYSMTPSMGAFAKNNIADGKPLVPATKSAVIGLIGLQKPGEDST